jgi:hypothetical protein
VACVFAKTEATSSDQPDVPEMASPMGISRAAAGTNEVRERGEPTSGPQTKNANYPPDPVDHRTTVKGPLGEDPNTCARFIDPFAAGRDI